MIPYVWHLWVSLDKELEPWALRASVPSASGCDKEGGASGIIHRTSRGFWLLKGFWEHHECQFSVSRGIWTFCLKWHLL